MSKLICIKTIISNSFSSIKIYYKKNHYYNIEDNIYNKDKNVIFIINERGTALAFVHNKNIQNIGNWGEMKDYFITEKELRKNKLIRLK